MPRRDKPCHDTLCQATRCLGTVCYAVPRQATQCQCHAMQCHIMPYHAMQCRAIPHNATPHHARLHHAVPHDKALCGMKLHDMVHHIIQCDIMSHPAMPCHATHCLAALWITMLGAGCGRGRGDNSRQLPRIHHGMPIPVTSQLWCGHGDRVVPGLRGDPPLPGFSPKKQPKQKDFPICHEQWAEQCCPRKLFISTSIHIHIAIINKRAR